MSGRTTTLRRLALLAPLLCALSAAGCAGNRPTLLNPGTAAQQRQTAQYFDPYPEPDVGPSVFGGRPRDYQTPPAEGQRPKLSRIIGWGN